MAFLIGMAANGIAYGVTKGIVNTKASNIVNLGTKAKSLAVQTLQGHPLNMGSQALKANMRNAFKHVTQPEVVKLLMKANPFLRYSIYSASTSSLLSEWI